MKLLRKKIICMFILACFFNPQIGYSIDSSRDFEKETEFYIDYEEAIKGNPIGQYNLGILYDQGLGTTQDFVKAFYWYEKSAIQGYSDAQRNLGIMYVLGKGITQDSKKAFEWTEKAAMQMNGSAQYNLAIFYENGEGIEKSLPHAWAFYFLAYNSGFDDALDDAKRLLGQMNKEEKTQAQTIFDEIVSKFAGK